ncbi:DUF1297 domain-containing protein [Candidatus Daviesbacteria bacterium]|nr:DUF1297 domain-containing protein [Candidatus Daviesbacteria bacterium]
MNNQSLTIAVLGSHSALDVCRGAKDLGFNTLVICEKGKEKTYQKFYRSQDELGCVDGVLVLEKFADILKPAVQEELRKRNCIFIPHRSFEVYLNFDYKAIEEKFKVPIFGNKFLLKIEERGVKPNQYDLLEKAKIRIPKQFSDPKKIDRLCIIKVLEKERGFERAFFLCDSYKEYQKQVEEKLDKGIFTKEQLDKCVIEEFMIGVQVNLNYFFSPVDKRLELLGTDTRRQTNIEGLIKTPAPYQQSIMEKVNIKYEEAGHIAVTVLESMLEQIFELGERFVRVSQKLIPPGVIGPFALQAVIVPGPPKKDIIVFDVSPRMPGSPGTFATPYSGYLFRQNISVGKRVAMEIKNALEKNNLEKITT